MHKGITAAIPIGIFVAWLTDPSVAADKSALTNPPKAAAPGTTTGGTAARPSGQGPAVSPKGGLRNRGYTRSNRRLVLQWQELHDFDRHRRRKLYVGYQQWSH